MTLELKGERGIKILNANSAYARNMSSWKIPPPTRGPNSVRNNDTRRAEVEICEL